MILRCVPNNLSSTHPHSPIGEPEPPSADRSPLSEHIQACMHEDLSQETLHSDNRLNPSPSPFETGPEEKVLSAETPQTQRVLPSELLSFFNINVQQSGPNKPSLTDIVSVWDLQTPDFILLTETPLRPKHDALTHTLRNRGYKIHYQSVNAPTPRDTLPEVRLPDYFNHSGGDC